VVVSTTSITCVVPAGVAGVVDVVVLNGDNQTKTLTRAYTYVSAPTVSSSVPKSLPATGARGTWLFLVSVILIGLGVVLQRTRVRRIS
jgi:LPXTG-motif cell wall-anchored protein